MIGLKKKKSSEKGQTLRYSVISLITLWSCELDVEPYSISCTRSLKLELGKTNKAKAFWEILMRREKNHPTTKIPTRMHTDVRNVKNAYFKCFTSYTLVYTRYHEPLAQSFQLCMKQNILPKTKVGLLKHKQMRPCKKAVCQ